MHATVMLMMLVYKIRKYSTMRNVEKRRFATQFHGNCLTHQGNRMIRTLNSYAVAMEFEFESESVVTFISNEFGFRDSPTLLMSTFFLQVFFRVVSSNGFFLCCQRMFLLFHFCFE